MARHINMQINHCAPPSSSRSEAAPRGSDCQRPSNASFPVSARTAPAPCHAGDARIAPGPVPCRRQGRSFIGLSITWDMCLCLNTVSMCLLLWRKACETQIFCSCIRLHIVIIGHAVQPLLFILPSLPGELVKTTQRKLAESLKKKKERMYSFYWEG